MVHKLLILSEAIVVESTRSKAYFCRLISKRLHYLRVTMPLINGTVRREKVKVLFTIYVPNKRAFTT